MNSLSWLIYLASVANGLSVLLLLTGLVLALATGISCIGMWAMSCEANSAVNIDHNGKPDRNAIAGAAWVARWQFVFRWTWALCAACLLLFVFIPSSNTMYAIAASQVGEQVVKSEAVQGIANDATKALQSWIKRQIEPPSDKTEKKDR